MIILVYTRAAIRNVRSIVRFGHTFQMILFFFTLYTNARIATQWAVSPSNACPILIFSVIFFVVALSLSSSAQNALLFLNVSTIWIRRCFDDVTPKLFTIVGCFNDEIMKHPTNEQIIAFKGDKSMRCVHLTNERDTKLKWKIFLLFSIPF